MGTTTFSGPVKAGNIFNTSGTTVGQDLSNVGTVVMSQSAAWQQTTATTTGADSSSLGTTRIIIPAKSQILEMAVYITTASAAANLTVGTTAAGVELGSTLALTTGVLITKRFSAEDITALWADVGDTDVELFVTSSTGSSGRGVFTVTYVQASDITLIA